MKKLIVIICFGLFSCNQLGIIKNLGEITSKDGMGNSVKLKYKITNHEEFKKHYKFDDFKKLIDKTENTAKGQLKRELTYVPLEISLYILDDTTRTHLIFAGSNAYGTPGKLEAYCTFVGLEMIDEFVFSEND